MPWRYDDAAGRDEVRRRLQGLGERSARKSYYPALQERLAELERFRTLLDESSEGILLLDAATTEVVDANGSAARQLGLSRDRLVGSRLTAYLDEDGAARLLAAAAVPAGEQVLLRVRLRRAGGQAFPAELGLRRVTQEGRGWLVAVARDVTELEEMRARLAVTDRMASIGTLAAGVAHEINNPLSYVMANVDFLRRFLARLRRAGLAADGGGPGPGPGLGDGLEEAEAAVADALDGAERVREIVRDLRVLSRPGDEERTRLDLRRVVDTAASMVAHEVRHRARLVKEYRAPPAVLANDGRLTQVLLNLLVNAAHAIPEGQLARNEIRVVVGGTAEEAVVEVRDTGCGIAPEHLARVFEPFFTTKPVGVGTGLGLSICHRIVADLGGSIEAESAPGQGALFRVRLPAAPPLPPAAPEEAAPPAAEPGRARVLVVDDDARCARSLERLLGATHDVSTATSPADALAAIAGGARYDAILCDMMMPGQDGQAFYEELGEVAPELTRRVVFMSGGTFTERTEAFLRRTTAPTLEKPLLVPALRAAIDLVSAR